MTSYKKVEESSKHGDLFSITDEVDDDLFESETNNGNGAEDNRDGSSNGSNSILRRKDSSPPPPQFSFWKVWPTITFSWMQQLLRKGNEKPLELDDLYQLESSDSSSCVYKKFKRAWHQQINETTSPSLSLALFYAFGGPFMGAGIIKFFHDSSLFIGPLLLNRIIKFLSNLDAPISTGLFYVLGLFLVTLTQSLCLRQYFWWCYRSGMNPRSAVITAVYNKALVISPATMTRKTTGEITNLMSVDSSRLQELTPYLHGIWYSLFQIIVALYFLWQQMGPACLAGITVIIFAVPITSRVSLYMKSLQKKLSKIRDERIKLTNEVLGGMKVIKLQAWEREFLTRIMEFRQEELITFRIYSIAQCFSSALFTAIPLLVSITTFTMFLALGNTLTVATALTSLALFELLRFPLFMFPQIINNVVEAMVSIDRITSFLLERERMIIGTGGLRAVGVKIEHVSLVWEAGLMERKKLLVLKERLLAEEGSNNSSNRVGRMSNIDRMKQQLYSKMTVFYQWLTCKIGGNNGSNSGGSSLSRSPSLGSLPTAATGTAAPASKQPVIDVSISEEEMELMMKEALLSEAEGTIDDLQAEIARLQARINQLDQQQKRRQGSSSLYGSLPDSSHLLTAAAVDDDVEQSTMLTATSTAISASQLQSANNTANPANSSANNSNAMNSVLTLYYISLQATNVSQALVKARDRMTTDRQGVKGS